MIFIKFLIFIFLSVSLYSEEMYFDTISLSKIKKVIKKEEQIAKAYKEYILEKAQIRTSTSISILNDFLPIGFKNDNLFSKSFSLHATESYIVNEIPSNIKSALYDKYYSNENRIYTKAPLSKNSKNVEIILSEKEKYILTQLSSITTDATSSPKNKYLLDTKGVLHWYDNDGKLLFSYDKNLIVYPDAKMIDDDGNISSDFQDLLDDKKISSLGQQILNIENGIAHEYINIGGDTGIVKIGDGSRDIGKTIIQFSRRAGGMIINGDIYTWGNNANQIVGLVKTDSYGNKSNTQYSGSADNYYKYPVITGLVRAKVKTYDSKFDSKNFFSSPIRPKFVDFFSTVYHSTCGVTVDGAIYCGGSKGVTYSFGSNFTHVLDADGNLVGNDDPEMLYRSRFFDGITNKASKMFANNQIWLILSQDGDIYRWGYDFGSGFSGNGYTQFNYSNKKTNKDPEKLSISSNGTSVKFNDITYLLTIGYRKMGALSKDGDIYIWGIESEIASGKCGVTWEGVSMNLCKPLKVETDITFKSITGGLEAFVAVSDDDKFYKIYQPKNKKPIVLSVNEAIKNYNEGEHNKYVEEDDTQLLSVDFSSKAPISESTWNTGIVWVNSKNELKGDYFTSENKDDEFFKDAIANIKWKKIKVIQDDNGMCGIDTSNQMYCWGKMSFYRSGGSNSDFVGNTFMLPVFNTNLYDLKKDFLVAEGGYSGYLTKMTSGDWNPSGNDFFMKYPTYIGGFNYEFTFK
ncbi:hypothetical protein KO488_06355 [Poseidonibacter lekithochrous]|uniref:hypothetical protein n=1 Tax=Poseidonibacter TaxID=2321187 RepID=UPI001C0881DF|nr:MULTISPECIES: hypothetical protein [Poseidonibacter]MBU3014373.1 hypothetical protein [Poseidonibacter lekithochrous]MDO6827671.1 hypothetical protein [Poseidonibacter sp. 1_MG-2023]